MECMKLMNPFSGVRPSSGAAISARFGSGKRLHGGRLTGAGRAIALFFFFVIALRVSAESAIDQVRNTADRVIALLNDPNLKGEAKRKERNERIRSEIDARFNWSGIARGCLGRHWAKRSPQEQNEFIDLFGRFLERTYLDKIEPYYQDLAKIEYQGEKVIDNYASVRTVILTKQGVAHPVEYRLEKAPTEKAWRIYDAVIEGVSLVRNYRTQFDEIINRSSFAGLIKDLKAKVEAQEAGTNR